MYGTPPQDDKLTASIKLHEGKRLRPYNDGYGNLTIGWGRNLSSEGISDDEANYLLSNDIANATKAAQSFACWSNVSGDDTRRDAFIELVFNLGAGKLVTFTDAIGCLLANDFDGAANALLDSKWAIQQVGQRAHTLAEMIRTGDKTTPS